MTDSASRHVRDWFDGPLMAGFECTNYIRRDGLRLDLMAATAHDAQAGDDYALVARQGMRCVRDGITWHRIEARPGHYDWSSFDTMVEAADRQATRVMWDLLHFGWPAWTGPLERGFVDRFADFAARASERVGPDAAFVPVNEISFLSWACGDDGFMHPHHQNSGFDVKQALCAAFIAAARVIRTVRPRALIATAEPLIAVLPVSVEDIAGARAGHLAQYQALDMLLGRSAPWLGGDEDLIDVIGLNHYPQSQWLHPTRQLPDTPRSLMSLLVECQARYPHPKFIAETGAEGDARVPWFDYVMAQVEQAHAAGVDILATCLYPILNHRGWEDDRYCPNGLYCGVGPSRDICQPLADAIAHYRTSCGVNHPMCVD